MTRPKGKLFALLAIFVAIGLVTASGAFTSVSAERTVQVGVANDSAALLGLSPNGSSTNGAYATFNNDDQITLDLSDPAGDATGINENATTYFDHVINVSNQGTQPATISISSVNQNGISLYFYSGSSPESSSSNVSDGTGIEIQDGNQASLGLKIVVADATDGSESFNTEVTIDATT